jgi:hypothetical protein
VDSKAGRARLVEPAPLAAALTIQAGLAKLALAVEAEITQPTTTHTTEEAAMLVTV